MFQEEGLIERSPFYQMGREKGIEKGIEKGHLDGAHALQHALLTALTVRKLTLTPAQKARINATTDLATLDRWTCAALTARTTAAVFDDKRAAKSPRKKR